jgi:hypothetical protein
MRHRRAGNAVAFWEHGRVPWIADKIDLSEFGAAVASAAANRDGFVARVLSRNAFLAT